MNNLSKIFASLLLISVPLLSSCSTKTIIPRVIEETKPSYDGNKQDSGLISAGPDGAIVTESFVARYDALVRTYGAEPEFLPPIELGSGVSEVSPEDQLKHQDRGRVYLLSKQALVRFIKMNQWRKMGRTPVKSKESN